MSKTKMSGQINKHDLKKIKHIIHNSVVFFSFFFFPFHCMGDGVGGGGG